MLKKIPVSKIMNVNEVY